MKKSILLLILLVCLSACSGSKGPKDSKLAYYLEIKDALVATDGTKAQALAKDFLVGLDNEQMLTYVQRISASEDVRVQREAFQELSKVMLTFVEENGSDVTLYKQYCPMAFHSRGAFWLSAEEQVMNPYFGSLMLTCGSVEETIAAQ